MLPVHTRLIRSLVKRGELDRALEVLPSDAEIERRHDETGWGSPHRSSRCWWRT